MHCAIALETLNQFQDRYQEKTGTKINQKQALFLAGFDIHKRYIQKMQLFRSQKEPRLVKEGLVLHGYVRKIVKEVDENGRFIYTNTPHPMSSVYENNTVVTGEAVLSNLMNILEVGDFDPSNPKSKKNKKG